MRKINVYFLRLLLMLGIILACLFIGGEVKAGSINLNKLDFQIQLNEDGSIDVTENWNAKIYNTNTMFKDFSMDSSKFKEITNVEVYRVNNDGTKTKLTKINQEMYHVTKDCYYGLIVNSGDFEIAWGVSVNKTENRTYQIKYRVVDAIKTYNDCSEFYWQLVGKGNTIPVTKLTATINLPKSVSEKNNIRAWAHGPYNGNISVETNKVTIDLDYLDEGTMVETRIATTENLFPQSTIINKNRLNTILSEEQKWADEANRERENYIKEKQRKEKMNKIVIILSIIINVALGILIISIFIKNVIKANKISKEQKIFIDYFRDIPDKEASAGDASFLYYFRNGVFSKNISNILSATMLQLCLKKYIAFSEDKTGRKPEVRVNILDYSDHINEMPALKKDEQVIYEILKNVANSKEIKQDAEVGVTFTMKEFEKYAKNHSSTFITSINRIEKLVKTEQQKLGNYDKSNDEEIKKQARFISANMFLGVFLLGTLPIIGILLFINTIPHYMIINRLRRLTDKGAKEAAEWNGLKRYMEDFSLLNEKEVPDLVLWEKYLVYATAFGIADKVLKQLRVKYPDLQNIDGNSYAYMHLVYHSTLNTAFLTSFNTAVNKAYMGGLSKQASSGYGGGNFSSGGGHGGGFSGGGGHGGGGGSMGGR